MKKSFDWVLLSRYLSKECSEKEKAQVKTWMNADRQNAKLMQAMAQAWNRPEEILEESNIEQLWDQMASRAGIYTQDQPVGKEEASFSNTRAKNRFTYFPKRGTRRVRFALVFVTAVFLILFGLDVFQIRDGFKGIHVANGEYRELSLRDGSKIILDAGSQFRFPRQFGGKTRDVYLTGEGYFDVAADSDMPFVIHAENAVIHVLGTRFNVRAWTMTPGVDVSVVEGRVSLNSRERDSGNAVVITDGLASSLPQNGIPDPPYPADLDRELGWMRKEEYFSNTSLKTILEKLERWYDLTFVLSDTTIYSEQLTLHINNNSEEEIIELISILTGAKAHRKGKKVHFDFE